MTALTAQPNGPLRGRIRVPGDKSISHRALMIGALAVGRTTVHGLLEGADVLATAAALGRMGVGVARGKDGAWHIDGVGVGGLAEPAAVLDLGNSGTGVRLLMGAVATHAFTTHFSGDESLCTRPMERVAAPLRRMGAQILARSGGRLPLAVIGTATPLPITYRMPVPSAQVKSAILLAGLNTPGETTVIETAPTRDHTERMLRRFAVPVRSAPARPGPSGQSAARAITVAGFPEFAGRMVTVPGDVSSAAFPLVAALLIPGSEITLEGVGINPLRIGLIETLREMGADITISETGAGQGREGEGGEGEGEPIADITVRATALRGVTVPAARTPIMIDEYPILAVAAAAASGTTVMHGLAELRVKESDRLAAMAQGLAACGVNVEESEDGLIIHGCGGPPPGGATVAARGDHRIAMAFLVLGTAARAPVRIDDGAMIATSFPGFTDLMNGLGTEIAVEIAAPEGP